MGVPPNHPFIDYKMFVFGQLCRCQRPSQALLDRHGAAVGRGGGLRWGADAALLPGLAERTPGETDGAVENSEKMGMRWG